MQVYGSADGPGLPLGGQGFCNKAKGKFCPPGLPEVLTGDTLANGSASAPTGVAPWKILALSHPVSNPALHSCTFGA